MVNVTFPDGSVKQYDDNITAMAIAESISKSLAKAAIIAEIDGELKDLSYQISDNVYLRLITDKDKEALEVIRHDAAHLLAEAVKELFPETQVTIGPAIENGFYYDFARDKPFTTDDLVVIEKKMLEIAKRGEKIRREEWDSDEAD